MLTCRTTSTTERTECTEQRCVVISVSSVSSVVAFLCFLCPSLFAQTPLSLKDAERQAIDSNPTVRAGRYSALAATEGIREARSAYFPTSFGSFTGAGATDGTRIAAGGLNNPTILDRFAAGFGVSQLLTDFGRTNALVQSSSLHADSRQQDVDARKADVLLQVDRAYFDALRAQAVLKVAQQTVDARKLVADQVGALANSGLKSSLDVSFAQVNLGEAQLLLVQAQNDVQAAYAGLAAAMGAPQVTTYVLNEEEMPPAPPDDSASLVAAALRDRPDVHAARLENESAQRFADAERNLWMPSLSFVGAAGFTPYHQVGLTDRYSAAGINVTIPLMNGNLYQARHAEAAFRAQAQDQTERDLENRVSRDVTVAWLAARTAYQRLDLTNQLLAQASAAMELAQGRYDLGLSSIVELTQAQLNKTNAEIAQATAKYEYQSRIAALRYQTGQLK
ncbi:MAG TPA: TolC family protein [Vicinamibacterales bacterium]|nr:TolC family protein [Vicinamibacterales bacterium]